MEIDNEHTVHANLDADFQDALKEIAKLRPWRPPTAIEEDEQQGVISYEFVTNDGTDESLIQLVHCKCLFGRQLPKMPKEYIVRLVFDRRHICLVMGKKLLVPVKSEDDPMGSKASTPHTPKSEDDKSMQLRDVVVGGVCFRPFGSFAEIAFLAVSSKEQVRGYGSRLMDHLKEALKLRGITDLVTYADNAAVGYFSKQGFFAPGPGQATKHDSKWHTCVKTGYDGYIKDYDGANKMVCCIYRDVNYLSLADMRVECASAIWQAFIKSKPSLVRYKGLTEMPSKIYMVPGLEALAPPPEESVSESSRTARRSTPGLFNQKTNNSFPLIPRQRPVPSRLQVPTSVEAMVSDVIETALSNGSSWPFKEPVDVNLAPDYYQVVRNPMDLSTMKSKNAKGQYRSLNELRSDFQLMFENCHFYNGDESVYAHAAKVLEKAISQRIERLEALADSK